jgi:hypothetical protein
VSRNTSEPDSASLCEPRAASLADVMKPDTGGEAMGASNRRALRGGWGRRIGTDQSRNLGDPAEWRVLYRHELCSARLNRLGRDGKHQICT